MEMCYQGTLAMPKSYAVMDQDEMMYVEGGISKKAKKALVVGIVAVASVALLTAVATGAVAVALAGFSTVMKLGIMGTLIGALGAKCAVSTVLTAMGASVALVTALVAKFA